MSELKTPQIKIKVIGLGGGGCNAVNRMMELGMKGVEFIAANTDWQVLSRAYPQKKILLGPKTTHGNGAGGKPEIGWRAADESRSEIADALAGADMVFLTAGMGGGTGTGAIPVAAEIARSQGALTVAVVTSPFTFEGSRRRQNAAAGLKALARYTHTLIVVPNDRLLKIAPRNLPLEAAFRLADEVLRQAVQGITDLVTSTGQPNVDFADVKALMEQGGGALIGLGLGRGEGAIHKALHSALHNPLLGDIALEDARGLLVNFTGKDLPLFEIATEMEETRAMLADDADILWGYTPNTDYDDRVQVVAIVTGVGATPMHSLQPKTTDQKTSAESAHPFQSAAEANRTPSDIDMPAFLRKRYSSRQPAEIR